MRSRFDLLAVERGLAPSRERAQAMILAGSLRVAGRPGLKPGTQVPSTAELEVDAPPRYVSRGGVKLEAALHAFAVDPAGSVCLDVGASTGGFTDCLLQHGASRVYAVDAGRGQLANRLLQDSRVVSMERVNVRAGLHLPEPVSLIVVDVAFISLRLVLSPALEYLAPGGTCIVLLKPQFEAGRGHVGKGGVVRDPAVHEAVITGFVDWLPVTGLGAVGLIASPLTGADGNREFLLHLRPGDARPDPALIRQALQSESQE